MLEFLSVLVARAKHISRDLAFARQEKEIRVNEVLKSY
jgi:hypothetical protein